MDSAPMYGQYPRCVVHPYIGGIVHISELYIGALVIHSSLSLSLPVFQVADAPTYGYIYRQSLIFPSITKSIL